MYTITHHYVTVDDDDAAVVETETRTVDDVTEIHRAIADMLIAPGGRSGTTISLTVNRVTPIRS